jgi:hypothetical protein
VAVGEAYGKGPAKRIPALKGPDNTSLQHLRVNPAGVELILVMLSAG